MYFVDNLYVENLKNFTFVNETLEILTFYLVGLNLKILICCIYRAPSSNAQDFNDLSFNDIITNFPRCDTIITGDLNFIYYYLFYLFI